MTAEGQGGWSAFLALLQTLGLAPPLQPASCGGCAPDCLWRAALSRQIEERLGTLAQLLSKS